MGLTFRDGIHITSVDYFIQQTISSTPDPGVRPFYRGIGRHQDTTNPSVFRTEARRNNEKVMYDQLLAMHPADFADDVTTLDRLVRMQHHGLPTRLLDITSNPLIALYFAAQVANRNNPGEVDGEVLVFEVHERNVKFPDSDRASVVANLARLTPEEHAELATLIAATPGRLDDEDRKPVRKLLHFIRQEKPYFVANIVTSHISSIMVVRGKQSNPRIVAQSGAFLLFGDDANFAMDPKGEGIHKKTMTIPAAAKPAIRHQLDRLNINESTVYPSLEHSAKYLSDRFAT
ncbi:MAG TPA: FRG domain-containing protein [Clostridia bacterium]|nr:FRG domain-containing protein [Clostridia bacterium]